MSISNEATNITIDSKTETCSRYGKLKPIAEFTRIIRSRIIVNISCNACADRDKRYRLNKKTKSTNNENDINANSVRNSSDKLLYNIYNIEELINVKFRDNEEKDEPVKFSVIVNLKRELVNEEIMSLEINQNEDTEFREHKHQDGQPIKRIREVPTIEHYPCEEIYQQLCNENLINPSLHTYQQVYYWIYKFSTELYITDVENQLKSSMNFFEQNELINAGYKVICYQENDFIIKNKNISEIVIDSTFKTNQEKFELFAQYCASRVGALTQFFISLYNEGVLLAFVLFDKDSGKINAVQKAWPKAIIQLCLWHVEHAIESHKAYTEFDFINPYWLPVEQMGKICPEELINELLRIIKKHALMHLLIFIEQTTFLTKEKIRSQCPHLDRFIQILTKELILDMENTWQRFHYNRDFPSWWAVFKNEWKFDIEKSISTNDNYLTNINNWTCSCPAFLFSTYLTCKHLVQKYSTENPFFFPKFCFTMHHYDYLFIAFRKVNLPIINLNNNPWNNVLQNNILQNDALQNNGLESRTDSEASSSHSTAALISKYYAVIESRKAELASDLKIFEMLIKIINNNIENDKLYEIYKTLKQLLVAETNTCTEVLNSKKQQRLENHKGIEN
ncbi:7776_t:CDS:2 [Gigaspora margarita]|uniref:7776_t:CDS:1 n=1 Tax=Gigaspora margarita TaxID=4874 RepID=A0ABN7UKK2_GIGMA|nr:7776_t:CDS:2 [Gigaspora margarita]